MVIAHLLHPKNMINLKEFKYIEIYKKEVPKTIYLNHIIDYDINQVRRIWKANFNKKSNE